MAAYKIERVSSEEPREYYSEQYNTTTYYIKVMLEGHAKPVSIGKKSPDALKEGDMVYGTIVPTEHPNDNFKADKPAAPFGGGAKDQDSIRAQWAIGQAIAWLNAGHDPDKAEGWEDIEPRAKELYVMVPRVKEATGAIPETGTIKSGYEQAKEKAEKIRQQFSDGSPLPSVEEAIEQPKIPF